MLEQEEMDDIDIVLDDRIIEYPDGTWEWAAFRLLPDNTPPNMAYPGLPFEVLKMRDDAPDLHATYMAGGYAEWHPTVPEGRVQCALMNTDDGLVALLLPADHQGKALIGALSDKQSAANAAAQG